MMEFQPQSAIRLQPSSGRWRIAAFRPIFGASDESGSTMPQVRRVLIVEDEYYIALQLEGWLAGAGYEVVGIAATAGDAIETAQEVHPILC